MSNLMQIICRGKSSKLIASPLLSLPHQTMGRTFPNGDNNATDIFHPLISTSFFIACIAATFVIITSLCGFSRRKTTPPPQNTPQAETTTTATATSSSLNNNNNDDPIQPQSQSVPAAADDAAQPQSDNNEQHSQPLPPPPGRRHLSGAASYHIRSDSAASSHITSTVATSNHSSTRSMSMRLNGIGLMPSRHLLGSKREDNKKEKNLKHEDSIWKKTIILGDKCRVPDEDDDDAIVYDEKGNRISTYHRKHANSMALSRQGSSIDQDAIPKHDINDPHNHIINDDQSRNIKVGEDNM